MANVVKVVGVHPVTAEEPVHLIEIELTGNLDEFDFAEVTQEVKGKPRENWQAAYDERELSKGGGAVRFAFFFHYLDFEKPLLTPFGEVKLPAVSKAPTHLKSIEYEQP